jgi:S1-C subfamily serine protease
MSDQLAKSDTTRASGNPVGAPDQRGDEPAWGSGHPVVDRGRRPSGPPERPFRSRGVVATVVTLALVAGGLGVGIGYAIHGVPPAQSSSQSPPQSGGAAGGGTGASNPTSLSAIASEVAPELVNINTTLAYQTAMGAGTGMVVASSGRVITNNHVIAGATSIKATDLGNGKTYAASVVGYDVSDDVAVLQLQGASGLPTVSFSKSQTRLGDRVIAIGNAGGRGTPTAAAGVVTGLDKAITAQSELSGTTEHLSGLIETNAAIESGQSGGPLVSSKGRVVGMVTAGSPDFAFSQGASQGYAVPAAAFRSIATDIVNGKESGGVHVGATPFLGVRVSSVQGTGALVVQVLSTSPAAGGGIQPGDLIVGLAGQAVRSPDTVSAVLGAYHPGAQVDVQLLDPAGQQRSVTVTLVAGPPA